MTIEIKGVKKEYDGTGYVSSRYYFFNVHDIDTKDGDFYTLELHNNEGTVRNGLNVYKLSHNFDNKNFTGLQFRFKFNISSGRKCTPFFLVLVCNGKIVQQTEKFLIRSRV